jgi:uncharacterized protein DUF6409
MTGTATQAEMSLAEQYPVGTLITGRPWVSGYELAPARGIVIGVAGEYLTVWYRTLGPLTRDEDGHAVQATLPAKATAIGHIRDWSPRGLRKVQLEVVRGGGHSRDVYLLSAIAVAAAKEPHA